MEKISMPQKIFSIEGGGERGSGGFAVGPPLDQPLLNIFHCCEMSLLQKNSKAT